MTEAAQSRLSAYAVALFLFTVALALTLLFLPLMEQATLLLFLGAVVISSRIGARGPGLLATLLSVLACAYFFLFSQSQTTRMSTGSRRGDATAFIVFVIVVALVNWMNIARERAEEARRRAESKYHNVFEYAITGIYQTTLDGRYLTANPMLARMFGYESPEAMMREVAGENNLERHFYVEAGRRAEFVRLVEEHGTLTGFESEIYKRDGSRKWISEHALAIRDREGNLVGFQGTTIDISDRKRVEEALKKAYDELEMRVAERTAELADANEALLKEIAERRRIEDALRQSEEKFRTLVEVSSDWVWEVDEYAVYTYASPRVKEVFGYDSDEVLGKKPYDFMPPQEAARVAKILKPLAARREKFAFLESDSLHKDGSTVVAETSGVPVFDSAGNFRGYRGVARDITERKRAEDEVRASREQLRALSAHLQSIREEERTYIAREIHDELGQTLTALMMDLSWLEDRLAKTNEAATRRSLIEKTGSMMKLVNSTMDTVRKIAAELRPGVLDELGLKAAIEWQAAEFERRTNIKCQLETDLDEVSVDRASATAFFRIFQESLTNIARHAHATVVNLSLEEQNGNLVLQITDNGRGISAGKIADTHSLGLLGMRERAGQLGGEVSITGAAGEGTRVRVCIPLSRQTETLKVEDGAPNVKH